MRRRILKWTPLLPVLFLVVHWFRWNLAIDSCLDTGGVFDYHSARCRTDVDSLPYRKYWQVHWLVVVSAMASAVLLGVAVAWGRSRSSAQPRGPQ